MKEALRIQQSIDKHWNVPDDWTVGCCKVRFVVTVTADSSHTWALPSMGWGAKGMNTIELTSRPIRSETENSSVKGLWYSGAEDWTFAHEAGNVMSLDDDYREVDFGMGPMSFPRLGHEGHMMADYSGAVDQHEVEDVLRLNNIKCECGE
jgi:hypothetical protein